MRRAGLAFVLVCACSTDLPRSSPLDPDSPAAADGEIVGEVALDEVGRAFGEVPLDEVEVIVSGHPAVRADPDGRYRVTGIRPGTYDVRITARFHDPATFQAVTVAPRDPTELPPVTLARGRGAVSGRIHLFGVPESGDHGGTTVSVRDHPPEEPRFTVTGGSGEFHIGDVIAGEHGLGLTRAFYPGGSLTGVEVPAGGTAHVGTVTLGQDSGSVTGRIRLEDRDPPHEDYAAVTVGLVGTGATATAEADGTFEIGTTLGGVFSVRAVRADYEPVTVHPVTVMPGEQVAIEETLVLRRSRGAIVGDVAIPGQTDRAGVEVIVVGTPHRVTTGEDGRFRISEIPTRPSTVQLVAQKITPTDAFATDRPVTVELQAGVAVDAGTLVLSRTGGDFSLVGRVFDPIADVERDDSRITRSVWVRLDLSRLNPSAFDRIRVAADRTDVAEADPEPFTLSPADCQDPSGGREGDPLCARLEGEDGEHEIWVMLSSTDTGAEIGPFRGAIVLDRAGPQKPPGGPAIEVNEGAKWVGEGDDLVARVSVSAIDAASHVALMRLWSDEAEATVQGETVTYGCPADAAPGTATAEPFALSVLRALPAEDGHHCFYVIFYDAAGNASAVHHARIGVDRTPPVLDTATVSGVEGEPEGHTRTTTVQVGLSGAGAPFEPLTVLLSEDPALSGAIALERVADEDGAVDVSAYFSVLPGDAEKTIHAALVDPAGNRSTIRAANIVLDTRPPAVPVVRILEHDSRPRNGYTNQRTITLEVFPAADTARLEVAGCGQLPDGSGDLDDAVDPFAVDFADPPPPLVPLECVLPAPAASGEDLKVVQVVARDAAGNASAPGTAGVVLDMTPPPVPAFSILPSPGSDTSDPTEVFVASRIVTFAATVTGAEDVPDQMEVFEGDAPAGTWVPFSTVGQYVLASEEDGVHEVRLRVRDRADNVSEVADAAVTLLTTPPPVPAYQSPPPAYVNSPRDPPDAAFVPFEVALGPTAQPATFWRYEVYVQGGTAPGYVTCATTAPGSCDVDIPANRRDTLIRVRARDRAGNVSPENLHFLTHDDVAPPAPEIVAPEPETLTNQTVIAVEIEPVEDVEDVAGGIEASGIARLEGAARSGGAQPCDGSADWNTLAGETRFLFDLPHPVSTLCVRAVDRAGNAGAAGSVTVAVDTTPPLAPVFGISHTAVGDSAFLRLLDPAPDPPKVGDLALASGELLDPDGNFHHFEVMGGPIGQWTCLPLDFDPDTGRWSGTPPPCPSYDGMRAFFEIPLQRDRVQQFVFRAVDAAGNAGPASVPVVIEERSTLSVSTWDPTPPAGVSLHGDLAIWWRSMSGEVEDQGLYVLDAGRRHHLPQPERLISTSVNHGDLFGGRVAWLELQGGEQRVYSCELTAGLACEAAAEASPSIGSADRVRVGADHLLYRSGGVLAAHRPGEVTHETLTTVTTGDAGFDAGPTGPGSTDLFAWLEATGGGGSRLMARLAPGGDPVIVFETSDETQNHVSTVSGRVAFQAGMPLQAYLSQAPLSGESTAQTAGGVHRRPRVSQEGLETRLTFEAPDHGSGAMGIVTLRDGERWERHVRLPGTIDRPHGSSARRVATILQSEEGLHAVHLTELSTITLLSSGAERRHPQVFGRRIVWIDYETDPTGTLRVFDLDAGTLEDLSDGDVGADRRPKRHLAYGGAVLAWQEEAQGGEYQVRFLDPVSGAAGPALAGGAPDPCVCTSANDCRPRASGRRVVWTGRSVGTSWQVCLLEVDDAGAASVSIVAPSGTPRYEPSIDGEHVVWVEEDGADDRVVRFDLPSVQSHCIAGPDPSCDLEQAGLKASPDIHGDRVIWVNAGALYLVDAASGAARRLTGATDEPVRHPRVHGASVVYQRANVPAGEQRMRTVDLESGVTRTLAATPSLLLDETPSVHGDLVVFSHHAGAQPAVWLFRPPQR